MGTSGAGTGRLWWVIIAAVLLIFPFVLISCASTVIAAPQPTPRAIPADSGNITVIVSDNETQASVDGVVVRVANSTLVDGIDHRKLQIGPCDLGQYLVISAPNYKTEFVACTGLSTYEVSLTKIRFVDDVNYSWLSAQSDCAECHTGNLYIGYNEISEWGKSAHARVFIDPYFASIYQGLNRYGQTIVPDPYSDPAFKLDSGGQAGDCAYCHAPAAISASMAQTDLTSYYPRLGGAMGEGVTCDICHKVIGVVLDKSNYPAFPGLLSLKFLRTSGPLIVGPFSNIPSSSGFGTTTYTCAPVLSTSQFCASCHYGKFNDMTIYNSYGEWMASPYGKDPQDAGYRTCQDCHMSHMAVDANHLSSRRGACAETDPDYQNFDHNVMDVGKPGPDPVQPNSAPEIPRLMERAASLAVKVNYEPEKDNLLKIRVEVENTRAGHKFPTDSPLRHLILAVTPKDQFDNLLKQVSGESIPAWGGNGDYSATNGIKGYAGTAGTIYANLMVDEMTNRSPTAAYWNKTRYLYPPVDGKSSDTRLVPKDPQVTEYAFQIPDLGNIRVQVKLIYRFAFFDLMIQKNWNRPDVIVTTVDCEIDISQTHEQDCFEVP